jgi:cysteine desulfurase/selenocysteine lyase
VYEGVSYYQPRYAKKEEQNMDMKQIRRDFPATQDKVFLNAAGLSIPPVSAIRAIESFLESSLLRPHPSTPLSSTAQYHESLEQGKEKTRQEVAALLKCSPREIAIVESTTHGLNLAVTAIPFKEGDNVVLCDLEFMQVAIPFVHLKQTMGLEIRVVEHTEGTVSVDQFAEAMDSHTRAICVSSVQWVHGFRVDLAGLSELARQHGVHLIVDGVQQVGAIDLDVSQLAIDFLACGGHKWLNSPFGAGFLYVWEENLLQVEPHTRGYLTAQEPEQGWGGYFASPSATPIVDYRYVSDARKFETGGTSNYPGVIGLAASLAYINRLGIKNIQTHIFELINYLVEGLRKRKATIVSPLGEEYRSGIITFRLFNDPHLDAQLEQRLLADRIYVATRYTSHVGGTRVSVHFFNNYEDIDRLLEAIDRNLALMRRE